jgi:hypothetical protein
VHEDCPFEKTYCILKVARIVGFRKFQWLVILAGEQEGQIPLRLPSDGSHGEEREYVARVINDGKGNIEKITLRGGDIDGEIDLKSNVEELFKKLKELVAKPTNIPVMLVLEIDEQLRHAEVMRLIDVSVRAGFPDVRPVPIDPKKR